MENQLWASFAKQKQTKKQPHKKDKIVLAYPRVSSKKQTDGASLEVQVEKINAKCKKENFTIEKWFGGTYESAKTDDRKEFNQLLAYAKKNHKRIYGIVVYMYDRFSRTGAPAINLMNEFRDKYGILVFSASEEIDVTTIDGDYQKDLYMLNAKYDNKKRAVRVLDGM